MENKNIGKITEGNWDPDEFGPVISAAKTLPEGWFWHDYKDGSGGLYSPDKKHFFSYDLMTSYAFSGGIEYRKTGHNWNWDVFYGNLDEFKKYAEKQISKMLIINKKIPS